VTAEHHDLAVSVVVGHAHPHTLRGPLRGRALVQSVPSQVEVSPKMLAAGGPAEQRPLTASSEVVYQQASF
jgi:hypothetical protein